MELEKAIGSSKFESNYHKSVVNILYTYGWLNNLLRKQFDKYHITQQQFNILRILRGQHPQPSTINLLKERMIDKMSDASRIVERLVQKKLVSRCTNEKDRRAVDIMISEKGLELLKKLDGEIRIDEILDKNLSPDEALALSNLLDKFRG